MKKEGWWDIAIRKSITMKMGDDAVFFPNRRFFVKFRERSFRGMFYMDKFFCLSRDGYKSLLCCWNPISEKIYGRPPTGFLYKGYV